MWWDRLSISLSHSVTQRDGQTDRQTDRPTDAPASGRRTVVLHINVQSFITNRR